MLKKIATQFLVVAMVVVLASSDLLAQTRLRFRRGSTSTTVSGRIAPGAERTFVLSASARQSLTANISSGNGAVNFNDGSGTSTGYDTVSGNNYIYIVNNGRRASNFTLTVSIR